MKLLRHSPAGMVWLEGLLVLLALAMLGGFLAWIEYRDYREIDARERQRLETQARTIAENLALQLGAVNSALLSVRGELADLMAQKDGAAQANRHLSAMRDAMPGVRTLLVLDRDGSAIASSRPELLGKNFREREYFRIAAASRNSDLLHMAPPYQTSLGAWAINVMRALPSGDGEFAGAVIATLDPSFFRTLLHSVLYAPDMWSALAHEDGKLFIMVPEIPGTGGDWLQPGSPLSLHLAGGQDASLLVGQAPSGAREQRLVAQRTVRLATAVDRPLVVAVSRKLDVVFGAWRRDVAIYGGLYGALFAASLSGLALFRKRRASAARLAARHASEQRLLLDNAHVGIVMVRFNLAVKCNQRQAEMFGYAVPAHIEGRSCALFFATPQQFDEVSAALYHDMRQNGVAKREVEMRRRDGQPIWIALSCRPLEPAAPMKGSIWVCADITETKKSEVDLRIAAAAFDSHEGMIVTDANSVILRVNRAFTEKTGYSAAEIIGKTPRVLKSGRHGAEFYREMWNSIHRTGGWQGEIWDRRKDGKEYSKWLTISSVKDAAGNVTHYIGTQYDITERKEAERRIHKLAFFDQLTGLPNRTLFQDRLRQALAVSSRSGSHGVLMFIDLDFFMKLNDTLGHDKGDQLLAQVAQRLPACVPEGDTVARLGGDEFVVVMTEISAGKQDAAAAATAVANAILRALGDAPFQLGGTSHHCTASVGMTFFHGDQVAIDDLMKQADLALYKAKESGRNTWHIFDPTLESAIKERAALEEDMRQALAQQQFLLHYQPQMAHDGRMTGVEALLRWQHPQRGMVSPAAFIPLAEESRLILPIGQWVLQTACEQLAQWARQPKLAELTIAVNISAHQFHAPDFVEQVSATLARTGADPRRLKLELTESLIVDNVQDIIAKMGRLKELGVGFSLDDFGTGYSSLAYLKMLPLDQLKIDQSFVRDVLVDPNDAAIAKTIVNLAHSLGLAVIAEGVETREQKDFLADAGCLHYQGYYFSRPRPVESLEQLAL